MKTIPEIEQRLRTAIDVLRMLPSLGPEADDLIGALDISAWPDIVPSLWANLQAVQVGRRRPPTEREVVDMQEAITWLARLDHTDQEIVWLRAAGVPWRTISQRTMIVRPRLWQRWRSAVVEISLGLKAEAKGAPRSTAHGRAGKGKGNANQSGAAASAGRPRQADDNAI